MHHKSKTRTTKITLHLQWLATPYQIRAVKRFGEYPPGESKIGDSGRQRSQQLWAENPQFCAFPGVNIGGREYWVG
jgi:hypothetical protein